ncbi:hypothetical protein JYU34_004539 [Plutella xylostella]|uniref:Uncharacterized protein n=1 Tax=Plutella xylostella TaxID=51655 RepID=A0ABQ7QY84_PLUXY|nr:hypothetical protein JYU34_004539 [Plutella xylostella]
MVAQSILVGEREGRHPYPARGRLREVISPSICCWRGRASRDETPQAALQANKSNCSVGARVSPA